MSFASSPPSARRASVAPDASPLNLGESAYRCSPGSRRLRAAIAGLVALVGAQAMAQAPISIWGGGTGSWLTATNWSDDILPNAQRDVFVGPGTVQIGGLGAAALLLDVTGGRTRNPTNGQVTGDAPGRVELGAGGGLTTFDARIGTERDPINRGASVSVSNGALWTNTRRISVGDGSIGLVEIRSGGEVRSQEAWIGMSGNSSGTINVDNATLDIIETLFLGNNLIPGRLNVSGTNALVEAGIIRLQATSTVNLNAGVVRTPNLIMSGNSEFYLHGGLLNVAGVQGESGSPRLNLNGGTLRSEGGPLFTGFPAFSVSLGGLVTIETDTDNVAASNLSGLGGLVKTGTGTLLFNRANSYLRGTSVRGGTLRLANGGLIAHETAFELGIGELVVADLTGDVATLLLGPDGEARVHSTFVGRQAGSTGTVRLDSGTLATRQLAEGDGAGAVRFDGGTLRLTADQPALFTGFESGDLTLQAGGGTLDTQTFAVRPAQVFTGPGALRKIGAGTLTLPSAASFSGGARVEAGTVRVEHASALGSGSVTVSGATSRLLVSDVVWSRPTSLEQGGVLEYAGTAAPAPGLALANAGVVRFAGTHVPTGLVTTPGSLDYAASTSAGNASLDIGGTLTFSGLSTSGTAFLRASGGIVFRDLARFTSTANLPSSLRFEGASSGVDGSVLGGPGTVIDFSAHTGLSPRLGSVSGSGEVRLGTRTVGLGRDGIGFTFDGEFVGGAGSGLTLNGGFGIDFTAAQPRFSGSVLLERGIVSVNNASGLGLGSGLATISAAATLAGSGRVGAVRALGRVSPGFFSVGTLTFDTLTLEGDSTVLVELAAASGARGVAADYLACGTVVFSATSFRPVELRLGSDPMTGEIAGFDPAVARRWTVLRTGTVRIGAQTTSTPPALDVTTFNLSVGADWGEFASEWVARDGGWELDVLYTPMPSSGTDLSYAAWALGFPAAWLGAPGDDPDGDGWSNALEYLAGTDPLGRFEVPVAPMVAREGVGSLVFTFDSVRQSTVQPASLEQSGDLVNWSPANRAWLTREAVPGRAGFERWRYTVPATSVPLLPRIFVRVAAPAP